MAAEWEHTVPEADVGIRIDSYLAAIKTDLTRSSVQKLLEEGNILVNQRIVEKNYRIKAGDQILVRIPEPAPMDAKPQAILLDILMEDEDLLVVNKPKGMVVHPAAGHWEGTLVNALLAHCGDSLSGINGVMRPGIVHRIDKDTSGLLLVAKNDFAHDRLAAQIKAHTFLRRYEAVARGHLRPASGTVDAPIGRHPVQRKKMAVTPQHSRHAVTHYETLAEYPGFAHMALRLETGRTHQIRVHMAYLGHPIAGDTLYGAAAEKAFSGQCLHAKHIGFTHPRSGDWIQLESALPTYFEDFLGRLQQKM